MKKAMALFVIGFLWIGGAFFNVAVAATATDNKDLTAVQSALQATFKTFSDALATVAKAMSPYGVAGAEVGRILQNHYLNNSYLMIVSTVDANGMLAAAYSTKYHTTLGEDVVFQKDVKTLLATHHPVLSELVHTVQGPKAIILYQPVFSPQNKFRGAVCGLIAPDYLMRTAVAAANLPTSATTEIWALQTDGRFLYNSADPDMIDSSIVSEDFYQHSSALRALGTKILKKASGSYKLKNLGKTATWITVKLYDTPWRIVVVE